MIVGITGGWGDALARATGTAVFGDNMGEFPLWEPLEISAEVNLRICWPDCLIGGINTVTRRRAIECTIDRVDPPQWIVEYESRYLWAPLQI